RAVIVPEIEVTDPELGVHVHQKIGDVAAPDTVGDAHVEGAGEMQRLQIVAPGKTEMMIAPAACHREIELVAARTLERPTIGFDGLLEHVDGMRRVGGFILVNDGHTGSKSATQREAVVNQTGTRFCRRTRVRLRAPWDKQSHSQLCGTGTKLSWPATAGHPGDVSC